jgi:hypothetical protein
MARHAASPLRETDVIDAHQIRMNALELTVWHNILTAPGYQPLPAELSHWAAVAAQLLQEIAR